MKIDGTSLRSLRAVVGTSLLAMAAWGCSFSGEPESRSGREPDPGSPPSPPVASDAEYVKDSVLVRFKSGASSRQLRAGLLARVGGSMRDLNNDGIYDGFANLTQDGTLAKIDLDKSTSVEAALKALRQDPSIQYAERNYIQKIAGIPNDTRFAELYGMNNTGQTGGVADADIDAPEAWDVTTGSRDIVVAVIDTGVDYTHPDLAANIWTNPGEIAGNGLDDDGNGVIDDVHGFNAITGGGDPMDDNNHGTHCSGTLGGHGNNATGVAGVNWEVSIMAIKFLSGAGSGTTADAIEGINYAVGRKNAGVNLRVLSNSWGGGGFSQALLDAINAADAADMMFVAAAGNSGSNNDVTPSFPASYSSANVVAVASTNASDTKSPSSSFGLTSVDLGAPGVSILSTIPGNSYAVFSGTSMATPHVAGTAALVLSVNPTLTTAELKDILLTTGDPNPALAGITVSGRRLNAANAVAAAGPPVPRFGLSAAPGSRTVVQNESTTFDVGVTSVGGFTGDVTFTATATPALTDGTLTFTPGSAPAPGASVLSVTTSCATAPGTYTIAITGTSGELTKTANATLVVRPFGAVSISQPSTDTPISIPDNTPAGITSTLAVAQSASILELSVEVNITHTFIGDLLVTLVGPGGQNFVLHNRAGGATDNLRQTFSVTGAAGLDTAGNWQLKVQDLAGLDVGTLDSWTLLASAAPATLPPTAAFTFAANRLAVQFTDGSSDTGCSGGAIASWAWSFGDGQTSTAQSPSHTYAASGTYTVTLTVTDSDGLTGTVSNDVTVTRPNATLSIERVVRNRATFEFSVDLTWSGLSGTLIDFYRNSLLVDIPNNTGSKRDTFRRYETSFTWKVCEQQSTVCSNEVSIVFGASADSVTVVTKQADGTSVSRVVTIEDQ
jgi:subtilisin family serine protease/subtilisin-like proprotein convertase family protein